MKRSFTVLILNLLALATVSAQGVSLHDVVIYPNGTVLVRYSKSFATCAHLRNTSGQLVHSNNFFCALGTEVLVTQPLSSFSSGFGVGSSVHLCNGNNYNVCSSFVTVRAATLVASPATLSAQSGGTLSFALNAGSGFGGQPYLLAGSLSGSVPGFDVGPFHVGLNPDLWFDITVFNPAFPLLINTLGVLDAQGQASASIIIPPGIVGLANIVANHAFVVVSGGNIAFVSNSEPQRFL